MTLDSTDTIVAIASAPGPGVRGIVRLSGPDACLLALQTFTPKVEMPRCARRFEGHLVIDGLRHPLPAALLLWPDSRSYTGQPMAEFHTVGSPPLLSQLVAHCLARGARPAGPGEFTLRAFLAGKLDLTRAEAVLAVINADRADQLDVALKQLAGGLSGPLTVLRDRLMDMLAHLEANLDFAEEPDVGEYERHALAAELGERAAELARLADRLRDRERAHDRPRVALCGPPNAGKSRLFNALLGRDQAIVSPLAGTTRDYLAEPCVCGGMTIELIDTAGAEEARDAIEGQAQAKRLEQARRAELVLECRSGDTTSAVPEHDRPTLLVWTKVDRDREAPEGAIATSALTGEGLDQLRKAIASALAVPPSEGPAIASTSARCRESLRRASESLEGAARAIREGLGDEIVALELRQTIDDLGQVVGAVVTEDLLDRIFGAFCIGK